MSNSATSFTSSERSVMQYIRTHEDEVPSMGVRALAQATGVSTATVVRLSQKLGFAGYAEYRYQLSRNLNRKQAHGKETYEAIDSLSPVDEILTTARLLNSENVERAADALVLADPIVIVGNGLSHIAAEYLHHYLFSASRPSLCAPNTKAAADIVRESGSSTVVVAITLSGTGNVTQIVREAHNRGIYIISITCSLTSELVALSDVCLLATSAGRPVESSRLGIITAVDALARTYAHRHPHGNVEEEEVRA